MRFYAAFLFAVCLLPSCLIAQTTEADIRSRLVGAPLYLRGLWAADKLEFDGAGELKGTSAATTFTLAGMDVTSVKLGSGGLELEGQRAGLWFEKDQPRRMGLKVPKKFGGTDPEKLSIRIAKPANGDYTAALGSIFTDDLADLVPAMPQFWQDYARKHFLPAGSGFADETPAAGTGARPNTGAAARSGSEGDPSVRQPADRANLRKIGGGVSAPVPTYQAEPEFSAAARAQKFAGVSLITLIVDANGMPQNVHILRPNGIGLDEKAIEAVSKYRFKPAMEGGKPVPVQLNVEVNFQVF